MEVLEHARRLHSSRETEEQKVGDLMLRAMDTIDSAMHVYKAGELCFSFNGGKDSTVVLHLLRAVCARRGERGLGSVRCVYFETRSDFSEVDDFMVSCAAKYDFELERLPRMQEGMTALVRDGVRAVLLGTRRSDPDGKDLETFTPTSSSWPPMMRVSPVLSWRYSDVWTMLRSCDLPYCSLYDQGYTSLGTTDTTSPNPSLLKPDGHYLPAFELRDDEKERDGRHKA